MLDSIQSQILHLLIELVLSGGRDILCSLNLRQNLVIVSAMSKLLEVEPRADAAMVEELMHNVGVADIAPV